LDYDDVNIVIIGTMSRQVAMMRKQFIATRFFNMLHFATRNTFGDDDA
jgi:hypothetical protein